MDRTKVPLRGIREFGPFLQLIEEGYSPQEIREALVHLLAKHLVNPQVIEDLPPEVQLVEGVNVAKVLSDPWVANRFHACLQIRRRALIESPKVALDTCAAAEVEVVQGLARYWSMLQLEQRKGELPIEEFAVEVFRNIGDLIEGVLQPFLRELLVQVRLSNGDTERAARPQGTLGQVVADLIKESPVPDLFAPPPWGVRLNQWRNIAQHHSFFAVGDVISCQYGVGDKEKTFSIAREELMTAVHLIYKLFLAIKLSRTLFWYDNWEEMRKRFPRDFEREDHTAFNFAALTAAQGFETLSLAVEDGRAVAVLQDITDIDPDERRLHASQFVYVLWTFTHMETCALEYREKDGTPSLLTTAQDADCAEVAAAGIDMKLLAERVQFKDLKASPIKNQGEPD